MANNKSELEEQEAAAARKDNSAEDCLQLSAQLDTLQFDKLDTLVKIALATVLKLILLYVYKI